MGMEAKGRVHAIFEKKEVSARFTKREFVLELADNPKYPQTVLFQMTGDKVSQLDDIQVGDEVRIEFSLRGREWRSNSGEIKYFNSLDVWRIERTSAPQTSRQASRSATSNSAAGGGGGGADDDIPFTSCELADEPSPIARVLR